MTHGSSRATDATGATDSVVVRPGRISEVVLSRPQQANALSWKMGERLKEVVAELNRDASVRVVVLRGEGAHFSGGGDFEFIESNTRRPADEVEQRMLEFYQLYLSVMDLKAPSIAVVRGSAVGAGLCLALACDFRFGSPGASLSANFVRIGLHPGMGATCLLPAITGPSVASELLLTGRRVAGEEARRLGLLTHWAEDGELDAEVQRFAETIARQPPLAVQQTVRTLRRRNYASLQDDLQREARRQAQNFGGPEVLEAIEAFHKRRAAPAKEQ